MTVKSKGFWRALEHLAAGAVMLEWRSELGLEFSLARPFLQLSTGLSRTYPCTNALGCGQPHHIEEHGCGRWVAICDSDEACPSILLGQRDLQVFEVNVRHLCSEIARALGFAPAIARRIAGGRAEAIGSFGKVRSTAYLMFPGDNARMARQVERLFQAQADPFVLFTPTGVHSSPEVESSLRRQRCCHIPLTDALVLGGVSSFTAVNGIQFRLERFTGDAAEGRGMVKTVKRHPWKASNCHGAQYSLRNGGAGIWKIIFDGCTAEWKDEKGLHYVAYLLKNPTAEPIHGTKLAARVFGYAEISELSLGEDDAASQRAIDKEAKDLMAVLRNDGAPELERKEARARLEELVNIRKHIARRPETSAEKTVRAVRKAIQRLHSNLASRKGADGKPHPVFVPFAEHIEKHLLTPSARYSGRRATRVRAGVAGGFIYEPPDGVTWTD